MTAQLKDTYLKVGSVTSFCVLASLTLGGILIAAMKYLPDALSRDATEWLQMLIGLAFFLAWIATIGCYSIVSSRSRVSTWLLFGFFPPFAIYAMFILIIKGSRVRLPTLSVPTIGLFALRAAIGWD